MKQRFFLVSIAFAVSLFALQEALPCSCLPIYVNATEAAEAATFVFSGEVTEIETVTIPTTRYWDEDGELVPHVFMEKFGLVTLRVLKEWKGGGAGFYQVLAGAPPDEPLPPDMVIVDCKVHFDVGKKYLVFAHGRFPEADYCMPNAELKDSKETIKELDENARRNGDK